MKTMYKKISKTTEINTRLQKGGKVSAMNTVEDIAKITSMNQFMDEVRKEYQMKERLSQISASHVILNA